MRKSWTFFGVAAAALTTVSATAEPAVAQSPVPPSPASPPPASAAPVQATPNEAVEQIVVTANKRRERQRDVANSVTAISGATLDRRREVSVQDLAAQVPGLSVEVDDKTSVRVVLRGLNTGSAGSTVASVLDDVPTNAAGAQNNASINTPNYDTYDLSRIEVLRGPQGTLYGATAEGGLIKYVTNPPDPTRYSGELEGGLNGNTDGGIGGTLKGFANLPLLDGKAALRITGWNEWIPGYISNPERSKTDDDSGQRYGWRASFLVDPTPDLSIRLTAERQTLIANNQDLLQVRGAALTPNTPPANQLSLVDGLMNNTALAQPGQVESAVYYGSINYDLGWSSLTSITSYSYNTFNNRFDVSNTLLAPGTAYGPYFGANIYGVPTDIGERQNSNTDKFNQEVRLTSDPGFTLLGHRFEWLVGGYYTHETSALLQFLDPFAAGNTSAPLTNPVPAGGLNLFGQLSEWAAFANIDYYFTPTVDLALGGRLSGNAQHSQTYDFCCVAAGPATVAQSELRSNDHDQLFSVAPRWHVSDDTLLYARIASGYRPGGPNVTVAGVLGIPTAYAPDRTVNYELGLRQDFFDKSVSIDVTGFYITWKDVQVLSVVNTTAGPLSVNGNAGSAVSKGVEWNLSWAPLHGLTLNATGSYQDSRLTQDAVGLGGLSGDFLPYVPNLSNSVNVDYGWNLTDRFRAYVSGTWSYIGERYTDFSPLPQAGVPESRVIVSHALLPGYHTGALRAGIEDAHYAAELFISNISDTRGVTYYQNEGGANFTGQATIIQPRTIGGLVRVKF
jgi:outer membrane receptor protein involved in Fe transport